MKGNGIYATGGLIGAVLASTCCLGPFILLLLGVSGAWISYFTALAPYQPFFSGSKPWLFGDRLLEGVRKDHGFMSGRLLMRHVSIRQIGEGGSLGRDLDYRGHHWC